MGSQPASNRRPTSDEPSIGERIILMAIRLAALPILAATIILLGLAYGIAFACHRVTVVVDLGIARLRGAGRG